jgi:hypothetical protein
MTVGNGKERKEKPVGEEFNKNKHFFFSNNRSTKTFSQLVKVETISHRLNVSNLSLAQRFFN